MGKWHSKPVFTDLGNQDISQVCGSTASICPSEAVEQSYPQQSLSPTTLDSNNIASAPAARSSSGLPWTGRSSRFSFTELSRRFRRTFGCQPSKSVNAQTVTIEVPDKQVSEPIQPSTTIHVAKLPSKYRMTFNTQSTTAIDESDRGQQAVRFQSRIPRSSTGGEPIASMTAARSREAIDIKSHSAEASSAALNVNSNRSSSTPSGREIYTRTSTPMHLSTKLASPKSNTRIPSWNSNIRTGETRAPWSRVDRSQLTPVSSSPSPNQTQIIRPNTTTSSSESSSHSVSVTIPPLANRPHIRTSPYDRLARLSYTTNSNPQRPIVSAIRTHPSYKSTSRAQVVRGIPPGPGPISTCTAFTQVQPVVSLITQSSAYCPAPDASPPAASTTENRVAKPVATPSLQTELSILSDYSLASDELMLDNEVDWLDSNEETDKPKLGTSVESHNQSNGVATTTTQSTSRSRSHGAGSATREVILVHNRLESVTEVSHDDLTRLDATKATVSPTDPDRVVQTSSNKPSLSEVPQDTVVQLRPKPHQIDRGIDPTAPDRRRHTTSFGDSTVRPLFSGLRRLRSIPGRHRSFSNSSSISSNAAFGGHDGDDLTAGTHLGERTCVLLASEQRQMVQEIQGIKVTLLKLKRLLSEDQWHLPVFHEQLSLTEPSARIRARKPLPDEWLLRQSEDSANISPNARSRTCSDSGVAPAPYSGSLSNSDGRTPLDVHGDRLSDLSQNDDSLVLASDRTAVTKLLVNLAQLQKENQQLYINPDCTEKPVAEHNLNAAFSTVGNEYAVLGAKG